jgi:drug/metabolite transporter (DMT)-like permease
MLDVDAFLGPNHELVMGYRRDPAHSLADLKPVLSTLLAALLLDERPGGWVLVGCAVTLSGVLVGVFDAGRSPRPQEGL